MFREKINFLKKRSLNQDIAPEEIFLDSRNIPNFDVNQFEGRIEKPISKSTVLFVATFFILVGIIFSGKIWILQVVNGKELLDRSQDNNLRNIIQFPERGVITDRNGKELAWNIPNEENPDFSKRKYTEESGMSHLLGFVNYPKKDSSGKYYEYSVKGDYGIEKVFNDFIGGSNGEKIIESNVFGEVSSQSILKRADDGKDLELSIDSNVQSRLYKAIEDVALESKFQGGAGIIMDVQSGEILAMTSYPEFDSQVMTDKKDTHKISVYNTSPKKPFINRAVSGLYTPGSIIKPFVALAALEEAIIDPRKEILSTGSIAIKNPYNPELKTIFKDWKAHGYVDMKKALAVSSNVYFYTIGGGYENQKGLGISKIEKYLKDFGFGSETKIDWASDMQGLVPNPKWKKEIFNDDWRVGDTYITAIGQFGFQITPIQGVRGTAFLANNGKLIRPTILKTLNPVVQSTSKISKDKFEIIQEGMRLAVTEGTARALNFPFVKVAAKTGTAEIGVLKESVNSWIIGYFPYEKPRYAFVIVMERRESLNTTGAPAVAANIIDWMHINTPEYLKILE
jgi:penicillin-binding protein 2